MARAVRAYVKIDGQSPPDGIVFSSVEFSEVVTGRPAAASELVLSVPNPGYRLTDALALMPGREIDVWVSLDGDEASAVHLAHAIIAKTETRFTPAGVTPPIIVTARSAQEGAQRGAQVEAYAKQKDGAKVRAIARRNGWITTTRGLSTVADGGAPRADNQSAPDMQFLAQIADRYSYDVSVGWDQKAKRWVLWWGPPPVDDSSPLDIRHNDPDHPPELSCTFDPIVGSVGYQVGAIRVQGFNVESEQVATGQIKETTSYDPQLKKRITTSAEVMRTVPTGATIRATVFGESVSLHVDKPISTQAQAQEFAENWLRTQGDRFISGIGTMPGDPSVRAGQVHDLSFYADELAGPRRINWYSGPYHFTSVKHTIKAGTGYTVQFGARKRATR